MSNLRLTVLAAAIVVSACQQKPAPPPPGPREVGVVTVTSQPVTMTVELPGRTAPFESSEVRPQVNGLIQKRLFTEGDMVRAGQLLYQIDAAPYQAAVASANAALARARAAIASSDALARRYGQLAKINAISKQDAENAVTTSDQTKADVAAQLAALRTASIDLRRTRITAPISGRIGRSVSTVGALVTSGQTAALTTIQRLDPIYVDVAQSSADLLRLRQQMLAGSLSRGGSADARVKLLLEDGTTYPIEGRLQFADVTVDETTGSVAIRAVFRNPHGLLLPGMYVRAVLVQGQQTQAILAPQQAVTRDEKSLPTALVVGAGNKVELRHLTTPKTIGPDWLVTSGLKPGDRLVMDGTTMLQPGAVVKPVRWVAPVPSTMPAKQ